MNGHVGDRIILQLNSSFLFKHLILRCILNDRFSSNIASLQAFSDIEVIRLLMRAIISGTIGGMELSSMSNFIYSDCTHTFIDYHG